MAPARTLIALFVVAASLLAASPTDAARSSRVAALQVGLRAKGVYGGTVDGLWGSATQSGVRLLQARAGLVVDGVPGPETRRALDRLGRPDLRPAASPRRPGWLGRLTAPVRPRLARLPFRDDRRRVRDAHSAGRDRLPAVRADPRRRDRRRRDRARPSCADPPLAAPHGPRRHAGTSATASGLAGTASTRGSTSSPRTELASWRLCRGA